MAERPAPPVLRTKTIALPRLNNLRPTLEGTALKLMEEAGELGAGIGKLRGRSGEVPVSDAEAFAAIARELLDVAQTAITMMFVLEEQYGVDVDAALADHVHKLLQKGYLRLDGELPAAGGR